jgi:hypothetical protein
VIKKSLCFIFAVVLSYPAAAQVTSGTIAIFDFTKDQVVFAADSRGVGNGPPVDSECKIETLGNQTLFTVLVMGGGTKCPLPTWSRRTALSNRSNSVFPEMEGVGNGFMERIPSTGLLPKSALDKGLTTRL